MFDRLTKRGTALAEAEVRRRRRALRVAVYEEAPAGISASEIEDGVAISGRGLKRRSALEAGWRWFAVERLAEGRRR